MLFICYPKCSTCQKAKKWLDEHNVEYMERHIVESNPRIQILHRRFLKRRASGIDLGNQDTQRQRSKEKQLWPDRKKVRKAERNDHQTEEAELEQILAAVNIAGRNCGTQEQRIHQYGSRRNDADTGQPGVYLISRLFSSGYHQRGNCRNNAADADAPKNRIAPQGHFLQSIKRVF